MSTKWRASGWGIHLVPCGGRPPAPVCAPACFSSTDRATIDRGDRHGVVRPTRLFNRSRTLGDRRLRQQPTRSLAGGVTRRARFAQQWFVINARVNAGYPLSSVVLSEFPLVAKFMRTYSQLHCLTYAIISQFTSSECIGPWRNRMKKSVLASV